MQNSSVTFENPAPAPISKSRFTSRQNRFSRRISGFCHAFNDGRSAFPFQGEPGNTE